MDEISTEEAAEFLTHVALIFDARGDVELADSASKTRRHLRSQAAEIEHLTTAMHNVKFDLERLIEKHAVAVLHAEAAERSVEYWKERWAGQAAAHRSDVKDMSVETGSLKRRAEAAEKELADIKRQAEDATEYVLAGMLREERARAESLEADRGSYKRTANQLAERVAAAEKERDHFAKLWTDSTTAIDRWDDKCTELRARAESLEAENERLQRSLAILSLRVLQSELVLDEKELAARDWGVELQCAALAQTKEQDRE